ncbi:hypothetical protein AruPA_05245 [Acidiphilium sp. PA]|uniref:hypothetical protein n=1 Tax=Acidiphilium sp. PA TaxID=2871705 RepID=UPI002242D312|nr:hypothetical protein [Acidiphilium sp. PA]MCW8306434.1 hypothetical protein [Acidiphilium sp. PA]
MVAMLLHCGKLGVGVGKGGKESLLFCEQKRSKKTLLIRAPAGFSARAPGAESFLLLFYKKEALRFAFAAHFHGIIRPCGWADAALIIGA